jgi:hypothetical protein
MVKFKTEGARLELRGHAPITADNVTEEIAKKLIESNPNFAELFIFEEDKSEKEEKPKKDGKEK